MDFSLNTPVAFIIYKRPDTTQRVFDVIRQIQPKQLLVIADGPRTSEEATRCKAARAIIDTVDWDCDVQMNYAESNMGLKRRVSSGVDWVFEHVEEAIILEDDCLPDISFFRFCEVLLDYYREEPRVMHISGNNFLHGRVPVDTSYYFSRYPHIWGWATWRRAWQHYDVDMKLWKESAEKQQYLTQFDKRHERNFWRYTWNKVLAGGIDTWSAQWQFVCLLQNGLAALPDRNLVSNIGVSIDATHTRKRRLTYQMEVDPMDFPLKHPESITRNKVADSVSVHEAILNAPSGNLLLDSVRGLAKRAIWELGRWKS
jgi:hypothetical protein